MAFKPLPPAMPGHRQALTAPTLSVRKNRQSALCIPRAILREAGLPDIPGSKFDVLVGEGSDAGTIALIAGSRYTAISTAGSKNPTSLQVAFTGHASADAGKFSSAKCAFEIGRKQLIVTVPTGYPIASDHLGPPAAINPNLSAGAYLGRDYGRAQISA